MSRHFIVDGYNLLHASRRWDHLPRERRREAFLRALDEAGLSGSARNSLTVILDGYSAQLQKLRFSSIQVVFSEDQDADTAIKRRVRDMKNPREAVVVTNDRAIQSAVRALGADVMACEEFLLRRKRRAALDAVGKMDLPQADAVNRELKRLWNLD